MAKSILGNVRHVADEYRRFIKSTYRLTDPALRAQFERHVNEADVLVKGPYVTLARDFEVGATLSTLLAEGLGPDSLARLNWSFAHGPLYAHQERAFRALSGGRNVVVTTGTGSTRSVRLTTETWVETFGRRSRLLFAAYWLVVAPFSGLIRRELLATARRRAERGIDAHLPQP